MVTGDTSGIGRALAESLAAADVAVGVPRALARGDRQVRQREPISLDPLDVLEVLGLDGGDQQFGPDLRAALEHLWGRSGSNTRHSEGAVDEILDEIDAALGAEQKKPS